MAPEGGKKDAPVAARLLREAFRFDFFQAVRVLERWVREQARAQGSPPPEPVGADGNPAREAVRFRCWQSLGFPAGSVVEIRLPKGQEGESKHRWDMWVSFLGLTGPQGALPDRYTRLVIERNRERNLSLPAFLDLFNHRLVSFFFRAWEKYRFPFVYERARREAAARPDPFTTVFYSLVGLGTPGVRGQLKIRDELFLLYAGLFADGRRPALSLERVLGDAFDVPVTIRPFHGEWLDIRREDRSILPGAGRTEGANCLLGRDAVLGSRVWDVGGRFRVRVGPLHYRQYLRILPNGDMLKPFCQMVRAFVGPELTFDVQVVLEGGEVPRWTLGGSEGHQAHLGWTTWLHALPMERGVDDSVFALDV
ncbi:MAG: type VI secretion system baseplate subunit TssG [Planctomycetes bacterium]|nr:type VI secretion system baseplate subunit TssG [Planctomycetota bacterium]